MRPSSFNLGEDLTEFSDGGIIRSQKVVGTGYITPNEGSSVKGKQLHITHSVYSRM